MRVDLPTGSFRGEEALTPRHLTTEASEPVGRDPHAPWAAVR